jgi:hypothetical protein
MQAAAAEFSGSATPENSAAFLERRVSNSLFQFIYFKTGS